MKRNTFKNAVSLVLVSVLLLSCFSGCSDNQNSKSKYKDLITIDVFDSLANYQGIQYGWFGKVVEDKFNMRLNIIAPNVAGGGSTMFDTRCASGNLGDLIICNGDTSTITNLVNSGLIIDMSSYLEGKAIMNRFGTAIESANASFEGSSVYAIPSEISTGSPTNPSESLEPTYGPYIRWDLYKELGYPELNTLEDLLPILKDMQTLCPTSESGNTVYGFSFFKDWDGNLVNAVKQPCCFYGYDENGFVLSRADGSDYQSIIDSDSIYVRVLRFFNEAYRMGLVDPESRIQNIDSVSSKIRDGQVLFYFWPWLSQSLYNTQERMEKGVGFMMAPVKDMEIFSYGCSVYGTTNTVMCVGKNAKYADRIIDFIDWLYSDEGIYYNGAQGAHGAAGPEGLTWEMTENGPKLTAFGEDCFLNMDATMPDEWGEGSWSDGISTLNYKPVVNTEIADNGYAYTYISWPSYIESRSTALDLDWQKKMGALTTMEYLEKNNMLIVAPGCRYETAALSQDESAIRNQCRSAVSEFSWNMIFADSEEEFDSLLTQMQDTLKYLDYDTILEIDLKNAKAQTRARKEAAKTAATD